MSHDDWGWYAMIVAAVLMFTACTSEPPPAQELLRPVRYEQISMTSGTRVRTFSGTAKAGEETRLSFKVRGTVRRRLVRVGDEVARGQLIAELDPKDYVLQVQQADAALAQARAAARNAAADYSRTRALYENNNASRDDLDAARAMHESAKAAVRSATKQLELARLQVSYTKLEAASKGAIAAVTVEVNENVNAGQPVVLLTSEGKPEVEVAIPEVFIAQITRGAAVTVTFDAFQGRQFAAQVTEVGVAATGMATTFPVTVRLHRSEPGIRPGMAANVAFEFGSSAAQARMVVPLHAVGEDREGRFVFIVEPQGPDRGTVHRRAVTVGQLEAAGLEILSGLKDGDLLVTAGVKRLEDGREVKLLGAQGN